MGAVHGVHLKYAAMSAMAATAAVSWQNRTDASMATPSSFDSAVLYFLWYCAALHALIVSIFCCSLLFFRFRFCLVLQFRADRALCLRIECTAVCYYVLLLLSVLLL